MELIQASPILGKVVIKDEGLAMGVLCELWIVGVYEEDIAIIVEVSIYKGKEVLEVVHWTLIPLKNGTLGNKWHE